MAKEQPNFESSEKLDAHEISELLKEFPGVKLDKGAQHFVIDVTTDEGEWLRSEHIPTWREIPKAHGPKVSIKEELREALEKSKNGNG